MNENGSRLVLDKSYDKMMEESFAELRRKGVRYEGPGSILRLILSIVNKQIDGFYKTLKLQHMQSYLSHAVGDNVDLIGELLGCLRMPGETDSEYKYRITRQTLVAEKANATSIRLSVLSVAGVKDVIMKEYTHGAGSFSVYPVTDSPEDYTAPFIRQVEEVVQAVKGYGIKAVVLVPKLSVVELGGKVLYTKEVTETERRIIRQDTTTQIRRYINERKPGEPISINEINRLIIGRHESVSGVLINHFMINNKSMFAVDQEAKWNERFIESGMPGAIKFA